VDQDHIGWKSWKQTARSINPTLSLFVAQGHAPTYSRTWGNLGETRGGVGKSGMLKHKSDNISETRKGRVKVVMKGLWELTNALSNATTPDPYGILFPKTGGFQPRPKTPIAIIPGTGEATDFRCDRYIHRVHPNKSPLKILVKGERGRIQRPPFLGTPNYLKNG